MSWLGVKYALACRDERVKGSTRLVLVALGVRVDHRRITTCPTSLGDLRWLTFLSVEQLRRILDDLETWSYVRRLSRGKNAVYALPLMAGPLFSVDAGDPVKMTDFIIEGLPKEIGQDARKVTGRMTDSRRRMTDFSGRRAGGVLFSEVRITEVPTTTDGAAADFLDWFSATFQAKRGYPYRVKREAALVVIHDLLRDRSVRRLEAMALWMFAAERDEWIVRSDYSLFVLQHKASYLEGVVVQNDGHGPMEATAS